MAIDTKYILATGGILLASLSSCTALRLHNIEYVYFEFVEDCAPSDLELELIDSLRLEFPEMDRNIYPSASILYRSILASVRSDNPFTITRRFDAKGEEEGIFYEGIYVSKEYCK